MPKSNTFIQNIFLTKKEKLRCSNCKQPIKQGQPYVAESENHPGICFPCSPFGDAAFLPPGDAAMTRRSKKHSSFCCILWGWNKRRKRFERKGQYVEAKAIILARKECEADKNERAAKNQKAAVVRAEQDKEYIKAFAIAIRKRYPNCPPKREIAIAQHACEKYSGRVGRTASAKQFDNDMIDLAVEAHIRHKETNYDQQFKTGKTKRTIRADVKGKIDAVIRKWS